MFRNTSGFILFCSYRFESISAPDIDEPINFPNIVELQVLTSMTSTFKYPARSRKKFRKRGLQD